MASFTELRDAIKTVLVAALPDTRVYNIVPEQANLPAIVVQPAEAEFPLTNARADDTWQFDLIVMVSYGDAAVAQNRLDTYLSGAGDTSIRQIVMRSGLLGRSDVMAAFISGMTDYGANFTMAGVDNIGCRLRLTVRTTGPDWR